MKKTGITFLLCLCAFFATAQNEQEAREAISAMNNFFKYTNGEPNADSALYFIRKVATGPAFRQSSKELLHDHFVFAFTENDTSPEHLEKLKVSNEILAKLASDPIKILSDAAKPIQYLTQIQANKNNSEKLAQLTKAFVAEELTPEKFYNNKTGRYGLMIYSIISENKDLQPTSDQLFTTILSHLKNNQVSTTDSSKRADYEKRAWYRYFYAHMNYLQAIKTADLTQKKNYLTTAFEYSPDETDLNNKRSYYFFDRPLISGKESYEVDYLEFISQHSKDKKQVLDTYVSIALKNPPKYKKQLQDYYKLNFIGQKTFTDFWLESIEKNAADAPAFSLNFLDKKTFSTKEHAGRWVLLDFWGTWCGPCREEHPDLQNFYNSIISKNPETISLLTIACRNKEKEVVEYMNEKKLSFPVAMSVNNIENTYKIQGYPSKILITPHGKYINIPFGVDWQGFIKNYCEI